MKNRISLFSAIIGLVLLVGTPTVVSAHEGRIVLKNASAACEGISIWQDREYKITGRCSGLVYPYAERADNYVLWVQDGSQPAHRVTDIEDGLFSGFSDNTFTQVFISVEEDQSPSQPGNLVIASGTLQPFDFTTQVSQPTVALPTTTPTPAPVLSKPVSVSHQTGLTLAVLVGVILAIFAAIFIVRRGQ